MSGLKSLLSKAWKPLLYLLVFYVGFELCKIYNKDIFLIINPDSKTSFSYVVLFITTIADGLMILLTLALLYYHRRQYFLPSVLALALAGAVITSLKFYFKVYRPAYHFPPELITLISGHLSTYSFPSGHAAASFVLAHHLRGDRRGVLGILWLIAGGVGALSRVYVGVHFPTDVWVGGWIGFWLAKSTYLTHQNSKLFQKLSNQRFVPFFSIFIGFTAIIGYLFITPVPVKEKDLDVILIPLKAVAGLILLYYLFREIKRSKAEL